MAKKIEKDAVTREKFQRLLSPNLAEMVVSGKLEVKKGGQSVNATVLFADIRGFTAMSENMEAKEVLKMLNSFFEVMVESVFRHRGTVDKFMGDGMMAVWGAPLPVKNHAARAVKAALDMRNSLKDFNRARGAKGEHPLQIGIGINTGKLMAGYMGSTRTMSYSVIGDTVNTASRLCSAAGPDQIVVSDSTGRHVEKIADLVELPPIKAKGKQEPVAAFSVAGLKTEKGLARPA
jgi:adenylate cyclase